ncbi:hypothetical protein J8F10_11620 [Gemmata sp. G18]|uniref:DUF1559 domain-containing protein n=1 Tax=Gemmata palustris TaxID=2822762 RepID=A0ABS5BSW1_9BACT|nr:hypothetical protein [Gemmata palustris]MBP3955933.1 hypothetical protein [Gemmata palustris]
MTEFIEPSSREEADLRSGLQKGSFPLAPGAKPGEEWNRPALNGLKLRQFDAGREVPENWHTFYRVFVGNGAAFESKKQLTQNDFTDGLDKTILIVEANESVPWPKPEELDYDSAKPLPKLGGAFPDGFYAAFADGTVRFIKNGTDEKLIRAMITRNGGEAIAELPPKVDNQALRKAAGYKD